MQEIRSNIFTDAGKFDLICLPCSCYQKKDGTVAAPKEGFLQQLVEKCPSLLSEIGKGVEKYGNCPAMLSSIPNTPKPTKFITFPVAPSGFRAENPNDYVFQRLQGKFKEYALLPGWAIVPRSDMVEFSAIKLAEIIKYYKLKKVAVPFEMFTFDREDKDDYTRIRNIMEKYLGEEVFMVTQPQDGEVGTVQSAVTSTVTYEEE